MEKWDTGPFQPSPAPATTAHSTEQTWNVVELEPHKQLRHTIRELLRLTLESNLTTHDIQQHLQSSLATFGPRFTRQLVRSLQREDEDERAAIVWLLTVLNDTEAIPHLQMLGRQKHVPHPIRLSAALALAGMNATREIATSPGLPYYPDHPFTQENRVHFW
ncbi:MAG TPA: hypothetical protein VKX46_00945 [Ktedonobacteraceae bacterium]|nr:hypothetical protein [Ktedonobacteraceae bacterium]